MTKKLYLSFAIFFTAILSAQAPAIQWQKSFGGSKDDRAEAIQLTSDGGYIVAGWNSSNDGDVTQNRGFQDYWIVKLNGNGIMQWQKSLGGSWQDFAYAIQQTSDGGYIVAGYSASTNGDITGGNGSSNCWIVKLSDSGDIQWQKSLGGSNSDEARDVQLTTDGGYIVAGRSKSNDGDVTGNHGGYDAWIVKLNNSGVIQWQKSLGGSGDDDASSIQLTSDGGYVVAGSSSSNDGDVSGNHGGADYWIVKLDSVGMIQWQKSLGGSNEEKASAIKPTLDGGYIVSGYSDSNDGDVLGTARERDYWIVKLNNNGVVQWQKVLGGIAWDEAKDVQQTSDGGYIVTGHNTVYDYWVIKFNSSGGIQWQKTLGGSSTDSANAIRQTSDGGYIVAGYSSSTTGDVSGNHGNYDMWIVKLYPENLNSNETALNNNLLVENPIKDLLKLQSKETITSLQLYNTAGQLVKTSNSQKMSVKELSKGIYILKIQLENGKTISEKIIKE